MYKLQTNKLRAKIVENGDNYNSLATYLGITEKTFCFKINNKSEFTRGEIAKIIKKYNLSAEDVFDIFFTN